jgi:hypothetical protein
MFSKYGVFVDELTAIVCVQALLCCSLMVVLKDFISFEWADTS